MKYSLWLSLLVCLYTTTFAGAQANQPKLNDAPSTASAKSYTPITGEQRLKWFVIGTVGVRSLATGLLTAGIGTAENSPREYGPHWEGFGKRYGMRFTSLSVGNAMEAGLGSLWGEDPRYFLSEDPAFGARVKHIVVWTFAAKRLNGDAKPAYARFIAIPASNFLSNAWRADSEASNGDALKRTAYGFLGRMGSNAFLEFWPQVSQHIFHHKN